MLRTAASPKGRAVEQSETERVRMLTDFTELTLSVIADAMPPLPKGEALAKPHTLQFNRKLYRHAKGSPFGRAVTEGD